MSQLLATYLNDHLAGAEADLEAAARLQERVTDDHDPEALGRLVEDIAQDAQELRRIVEAVRAENPVTTSEQHVPGSRPRHHRLAQSQQDRLLWPSDSST